MNYRHIHNEEDESHGASNTRLQKNLMVGRKKQSNKKSPLNKPKLT